MTQRRIYQDECPYFVTFRTKESQPIFEDARLAKSFAVTMFNAGQLKGWHILAYQIMPEHVHVLCNKNVERNVEKITDRTLEYNERTLENVRLGANNNPASADRTLVPVPERTFSNVRSPRMGNGKSHTISDLLKSMKGNFSHTLHEGNIWQPRFYTRIVNTRTYLTTVVEYIRENPVKEGLSKTYTKPPYQFFDWDRIWDLF